MPQVTIYTFFREVNTKTVVYYDTDNPSYVGYYSMTQTGPISSRPPDGTNMGSYCQGTTRYTYKAKSETPYATVDVEVNSTACGFAQPTCDIQIVTLDVTNETTEGANDGTINVFATSSFGGVNYSIVNGLYSDHNTTGYFTNVPPLLYNVIASDANFCTAQQNVTVEPFDNTKTHFKYRLAFSSISETINWECRLIDLRNSYDSDVYPMDLEGTEVPIIIKQANENEDKTATIISKTVEIELLYDGLKFTTDEFTLADPYKWFVELYKDGVIEFKGWLIPDETQDLYADPSYPFKIVATDGIPNLKGNSWGNGSGGNGYTDDQVQQYGLKQWCNLVAQCLDQLGYDYGDTIFFSSLRYNAAYGTGFWPNIGCWGDILYDNEGNAIDTYSALELLLSGMKLRLIQHKGSFILYNNNDLYYLNKPLSNYEYQRAFYLIRLSDGSVLDSGVIGYSGIEKPLPQFIGYNSAIQPINPVHSLNYDKSYNIKASIDFNLLALLYPNPSFEIGAVEGQLPSGMGFVKQAADFEAFAHQLPSAYDGNFVLRLQWTNDLFYLNNWVDFSGGGFYIDQSNKKVNISIVWREGNHPPLAADDNITISYRLVFTEQGTGSQFVFIDVGNLDSGEAAWLPYTSGGFFSNNKQRVTDFVQWNSFSQTTTALPGSGIGYLNMRINAPTNLNPRGNTEGEGMYMIIDYDSLQISIIDADDGYSKQTGEVHTAKISTGYPQANVKDLDLSLFTYPKNKRVAGNIFIGYDYPTSEVGNKWNFALKTADAQDRLPAAITKAVARNYSNSFRIFEGDFQCPYVQFYGTFTLTYYEQSVFEALSIELDCRNEKGHIVIIEISDQDAQFTYKYTPVFEKNARRNIST